ncbi:hypothetical protein [Bradyrhizobium sp. USDA 3458]|uniref:hypothetical protein n=1 Tax=Bradyrhizobium sp. USDA 3458 TaxID=2591461 RepID=UPI001144998B|nr:hypothetical protein [Bradyrhizobium sp. USDA 3458]
MSADIRQLETRVDRLWREFCEARATALESNSISDGIAAGRAWSRFLSEFVGDRETRSAVHGGVSIRK